LATVRISSARAVEIFENAFDLSAFPTLDQPSPRKDRMIAAFFTEKQGQAMTIIFAETGSSWRIDETCVKIRSQWAYLYRAVDREGKTVDFRLSPRRNVAAANAFLGKMRNTQAAPAVWNAVLAA
jgi:hypothetical protein